jgi:hypothetical protein
MRLYVNVVTNATTAAVLSVLHSITETNSSVLVTATSFHLAVSMFTAPHTAAAPVVAEEITTGAEPGLVRQRSRCATLGRIATHCKRQWQAILTNQDVRSSRITRERTRGSVLRTVKVRYTWHEQLDRRCRVLLQREA